MIKCVSAVKTEAPCSFICENVNISGQSLISFVIMNANSLYTVRKHVAGA
jgi:hypothetical protein